MLLTAGMKPEEKESFGTLGSQDLSTSTIHSYGDNLVSEAAGRFLLRFDQFKNRLHGNFQYTKGYKVRRGR